MNFPRSVEHKFKELFKSEPLLVRSPGRVNLIGEHTDYNDGFVLPAAIDKAMYFGISERVDSNCSIFALDKDEAFDFSLSDLEHSEKGWPNYIMGVVDQLIKSGYNLKGFNCTFGGDIPIGAGLSSSAALEAGLSFALNSLFDLKMENLKIVKVAQKAENEFVGVRCGIMDQYANIFGRQGKVLRLDCRSLECEHISFDFDTSIVLIDTNISRSLASSEYNRRRQECNQGVDGLKRRFPHITHLRDVTAEMLDESRHEIPAIVYKRCKYVIGENDRLVHACACLKKGDLNGFGRYLFETHEGLRSEYEVSCKELDYLVELAKEHPAVYGSRMMGAGFGGCTINLVEKEATEDLRESVAQRYKGRFGVEPKTYITTVSNGTSVIKNQ